MITTRPELARLAKQKASEHAPPLTEPEGLGGELPDADRASEAEPPQTNKVGRQAEPPPAAPHLRGHCR